FNDTVRSDPELVQAVGNSRQGSGRRILPSLVPGMGATHHLELTLLAYEGDPTTTTGSRVRLRPDNLVPHRWRLVIDHPGVAFDIEARPWRPRRRALAERKIRTAPRILQRFHVAHGFCHTVKYCLGVLTIAKLGYKPYDNEHKHKFLPH